MEEMEVKRDVGPFFLHFSMPFIPYFFCPFWKLSNARKITSSFCVEISFADKEEKPSLASQTRLFLTQYAGRESQIPIMDAA